MRKQSVNLAAISLFDLDAYTRKGNTLLTCPYCLVSDYTFNRSDGTYNCLNCERTFCSFESL